VPTFAAEATLFASSFAPLFVVFGLLHSFGKGWPALVCYGIAAGSTAFLFFALHAWRSLSASTVTIARARHRDADAIAYVATYVVPFAALGISTWQSRAALIWFLLLVGVLYVRAHLFYVNPILSAIGYRIFEAETSAGRLMIIISRKKYIRVNTDIDLRTLSDYIFLDATGQRVSNSGDR
jgi:hypothetical protein